MHILFVGGGTLGSVTPLLAVAEALRPSGARMDWFGTAHGPERALVEAAGIPFTPIPSGKFRRYWDVWNIVDPFVIGWALGVSLVRLVSLRPGVVVGAGSFVQVPVMWAAAMLRIPIVLHQLDAAPGLANRLVAPFAHTITATFPGTAFGTRPVEVIGALVRRAILAARDLDSRMAKQRFGFFGDRPCVLVLGGGTGAAAINTLITSVLPELVSMVDVIHIVGNGKGVVVQRDGYCAFELLTDELPSAYAAADIVIARAGMGTIAELGALGKAAVLIPMPGTHQEANVHPLVTVGAVIAWDQRTIRPDILLRDIGMLLRDGDRLSKLRMRIGKFFPETSAAKLAQRICAIAQKRELRRR